MYQAGIRGAVTLLTAREENIGMKIIIINGSPRNNGITAQILHTIEKRLSERGAQVQFIDLAGLDMEHCRGCCVCYRTGRCIYSDGAEKLSADIEACDGIVIGSPTYAGNVSGLLKTFIDRGHFVIEQLLSGKYALSVATGENYGVGDTGRVIGKLLSYSGGMISGRVSRVLPFNSRLGDDKKVIRAADRLFDDIKFKRRYFFQHLKHSIIFHAGIRPFVKRKGDDYKGVNEKWDRFGAV